MSARKVVPVAAALIAMALAAEGAVAQTRPAERFPAKPVRWVIPFPAGGATDVIARMVAQKLGDAWGQPVVVDNRAGATGAVGSEHVARSAPDGYTILMGTASTHAVAPAVNPKLPYDNLRDFTPVTLVATFPNMLVVHPSLPAQNLNEFIAYLKANPGKINFGSTGTGGSVHLAGELFMMMSGTKMTHVPYKGSAPALNDLLAGHVQVAFDNMTTVFPHVQSGRLRALGVAGQERSPAAPSVPAIAEVLPGFEANSWVGIFGPPGLPADVVAKIQGDVARAVKLPDVTQKLAELGAAPVGGTSEAFAQFVRQDTERWRKVVQAAKVVVD